MGEVFLARSDQIAGLGKLVDDIGVDSTNIAKFIGEHGQPKGELFTGPIIRDLLQPVRTAADMTRGRMQDMADRTSSTGIELNKAAWMYHNQDQKNYSALNAHTTDVPSAAPAQYGADTEQPGQTEAYGNAVPYPKPESFKLDPPTVNQEDTAGLIGEVVPSLRDVNESIKSVTRAIGKEVDPLVLVLQPIEGNWNEVRRIGESYKVAGNAMEASGKNLENGVKLVGGHWDGKAAIAFEENWARRQIAAMKWEGPVGRVVADVMGIVADEIRQGIKDALTKLKDMLLDYIDVKSAKGIFKQAIKKVPGVGWCIEAADLANKIYTIVTKVKEIVDKIEELKNKLKELLAAISNPVGTATEKVKQRLEPVVKRAGVAVDLSELVQVNHTLERPREGYEVGSGGQPWENG
ncbi:hypothetical protein NONI108955_00980 [Nocardia ninae]|uniref:Uncharacterized protein n=1 Tax=Nocardia ninae NBRC 108245 TaxID=1210091 RepID=A0A511MCE4_9NOCA|nr:hypothetical protein [Nocardia ninae]GEM38151.1 hypothetical protein NN4_26700 [Nocardia ninae NBRC 108245]